MSVRLYEGVNLSAIEDRKVRAALKVIDDFCRSVGPGIEAAAGGGGGSGPFGSSFITVNNESGLSAERALAVTAPVTKSDGGANASITLGVTLTTPSIAFGTSYAAGVAASLIRSDATIKYPGSLMSPTSSSLLTLTDNGTHHTLTSALGGDLFINATGVVSAGSLGAERVLRADVFATSRGNRIGVVSDLESEDITNKEILLYSANISTYIGVLTNARIYGYANGAFSVTASPGSSGTQEIATGKLRGPTVVGTSATWGTVDTLYLDAVMGLADVSTITRASTLTVEVAQHGPTNQYGIHVKERGAGHVQTSTNRYGLKIDALTSGTNRWGAHIGNRSYIESPSTAAITVLSLAQLATGAAAGAHLNFDDKAGNPPSPNTGDLWRNGAALNYRKDGSTTVDLTAAGAAGDNISVNGTAATNADFDNATPAAPVITGSIEYLNVQWQKDTSAPDNISAHVGKDKNGNPILGFVAVASAVNHIYIKNEATTFFPAIFARGSDSNVSIGVYPQGTGFLDTFTMRLNEVSAPGTPAGNTLYLYVKDKSGVSALYKKDDAGTEVEIGVSEFVDNVFRVSDDGDSTKKVALQCSGITTATTRTMTVPDLDFTIAPLNGQIGLVSGATKVFGCRTNVSATDLTFNSIADLSVLIRSGSNINGSQGTGYQVFRMNSGGTSIGWFTDTHVKSITVESPTNAENISIFNTDVAITITAVYSVLRGSASPSVDWNIVHNTDRSASTNKVWSTDRQTTSTTTAEIDNSSFADATVPANSFVWLTTSAKAGTVNEGHWTIYYTVD